MPDLPALKDIPLYGPPALPEKVDRDPDMPRLRALLSYIPDWDRTVVPPIQPEFAAWLAESGTQTVSLTRLPDNGALYSRYVLVRAGGEPGRYQVVIAFQAHAASWVLGPPRPMMDIRAAVELSARLVAESV